MVEEDATEARLADELLKGFHVSGPIREYGHEPPCWQPIQRRRTRRNRRRLHREGRALVDVQFLVLETTRSTLDARRVDQLAFDFLTASRTSSCVAKRSMQRLTLSAPPSHPASCARGKFTFSTRF